MNADTKSILLMSHKSHSTCDHFSFVGKQNQSVFSQWFPNILKKKENNIFCLVVAVACRLLFTNIQFIYLLPNEKEEEEDGEANGMNMVLDR